MTDTSTAVENAHMKALICRHLQAHGYTLEPNGYRNLIASKKFDSIVGEKVALVELTGFDESVTLILSANMLSEGRNCLVSCAAYPPKPLTDQVAARSVAQFCESVKDTVADLVIVRMLPQPIDEEQAAPEEASDRP
jgi:hypothetical protein